MMIGASRVSSTAWTCMGISLRSVITLSVVAPEHAFLSEGRHRGRFDDVQEAAVPCMPMEGRKRLDLVLVERGLFESRSKAAAAVMAGAVRLGPGRERAAKPGMPVAEGVS